MSGLIGKRQCPDLFGQEFPTECSPHGCPTALTADELLDQVQTPERTAGRCFSTGRLRAGPSLRGSSTWRHGRGQQAPSTRFLSDRPQTSKDHLEAKLVLAFRSQGFQEATQVIFPSSFNKRVLDWLLHPSQCIVRLLELDSKLNRME